MCAKQKGRLIIEKDLCGVSALAEVHHKNIRAHVRKRRESDEPRTQARKTDINRQNQRGTDERRMRERKIKVKPMARSWPDLGKTSCSGETANARTQEAGLI